MNKQQIARYMQFTKTKLDVRAVAFYILVLFCASAYSAIFDESRADALTHSALDHAVLILVSILYNLALFFLLMLSRWVFLFAAPILFYMGAVSHIFSSKLGLAINIYSAPRFFSNDALTEIAKSTPDAIYIAAMFILGIAAGLVRFFSARDNSVIRKGQVFAVILILAAGATRYVGEKYPDYTPMPFAYFGAMQDYTSTAVNGFFMKPAKAAVQDATIEDNVTTVIIFLEKLPNKFIAENTPLTSAENPYFMEYKPAFRTAAEELYSINNANGTSPADIFTHGGLPVHWLNIVNTYTVQHPTAVAAQPESAQTKLSPAFPNPFMAIGPIDEFLQKNAEGLFVVNLTGTPDNVSARYSDIFDKPAGENETTEERAYKNYTASIDAFLSEAIKKLKTRKAVLIAVALEREKKPEYSTAAAILWVSNLYDLKHGIKKSLAQKQGYVLEPEHINSSISGCAKIKTDKRDEDKNLCK